MPIIQQLLYQTNKSSHQRFSIKKPTVLKKTPAEMFSCEYCKISNNTCFEEHLRTTASENNNKKRFLGKATSINDNYMINMGGQRPKIGSYWKLNSPYLHRHDLRTRHKVLTSTFFSTVTVTVWHAAVSPLWHHRPKNPKGGLQKLPTWGL